MAWHWDEEVKVRAAYLKHSDCFPRAKLPSELEGSDGGIVGIISSLFRSSSKFRRRASSEVWISLACGSCFDVLALDTSHADSKLFADKLFCQSGEGPFLLHTKNISPIPTTIRGY